MPDDAKQRALAKAREKQEAEAQQRATLACQETAYQAVSGLLTPTADEARLLQGWTLAEPGAANLKLPEIRKFFPVADPARYTAANNLDDLLALERDVLLHVE